jgi:hypothetical protein
MVPVYNNIPKIDIDFLGNILSLATGYMMIYHNLPPIGNYEVLKRTR